MSGILKISDLNAESEGNLEAIWGFFCGSGHVIPKHMIGIMGTEFNFTKSRMIYPIVKPIHI